MIVKGQTKRSRRRRKFGEPIGSMTYQSESIETSFGLMDCWREEPIYKNRREEQSAKDKIRVAFKKHLERMRP